MPNGPARLYDDSLILWTDRQIVSFGYLTCEKAPSLDITVMARCNHFLRVLLSFALLATGSAFSFPRYVTDR